MFPKLLFKVPLLPILLCVSTVLNAIYENRISLRDYEFVGEDKKLASVLAQRMAGLARGENLTAGDSIEQESRRNMPIPSGSVAYRDINIEPDQLQLNLNIFPRVNVSLDYAELFNLSGNVVDDTKLLMQLFGINRTTVAGNLTAGRRISEWLDPTEWNVNMKIMEIMKQNIYNVQNRLAEIEPIIHKYQADERFRIAFLFNRLNEWKRDIRNIYYAMKIDRPQAHHMRFKRRLWYYEHVLRKNIDITYSIEFLIYMHSQFVAKMNNIMPREELEQLKKFNEMQKTASPGMKIPAQFTKKPRNTTGPKRKL